jgi:hypothetical protein
MLVSVAPPALVVQAGQALKNEVIIYHIPHLRCSVFRIDADP